MAILTLLYEHKFLLLSSLLILYPTILVIYRLYFHPLRHFPGPKLAAATKWYEAYYDLIHGIGGQFSAQVSKMHEKYGPIVRITPHELHVQDPDWFETLYAGQPDPRDKYPPAAAMLGTNFGTFGTVDHHLHRKRRTAQSLFFSKKSITAAEPLIRSHVETLCAYFKEHRHEPINLRVRFLAYTSDVLCDWAFGKSFDMQKDEASALEFDRTISAVATVAPFVKQWPGALKFGMALPLSLVNIVAPPLAKVLAMKKDIHQQAKKYSESRGTIKEKEHLQDRPPTVFQLIQQSSSLPASEKTLDRLSHEGAELFLAGSGPTSRTMAAACFFLITHPEALAKLKEEIWTAMPNKDVIPPAKLLEEQPWMGAVIKETLRVSAIVSSRLPLVPLEDLVFRDWIIPSGTPVGMTPKTILTDPTLFPEPEKFKPERWLIPTSSAEDSTIQLRRKRELEKYFVAFGKGGRMCLGMAFSMTELHITLATIFRRFELELFETTREQEIDSARDCFLAETIPGAVGVRVKITKVLED